MVTHDSIHSLTPIAKALAGEKARQEAEHSERTRGLRESVSALERQASESEQHKQKLAEIEHHVKRMETTARKHEQMIDEARDKARAAETRCAKQVLKCVAFTHSVA